MEKLRCKKEYGVWFYKKIVDADLDAPIYELYNQNEMLVDDFGSYGDMKYFVETGEYL